MCGILAIINESSIETEFYKGIQRGPDESKLIHVEYDLMKVMLGFHRLSINGVSNGSQPFHINGVYLICNGEIYNYSKLYEELDIIPTTNSDCEIILHLYLKYGMDQTLQMLQSTEYAFVLYDTNKEQIYVARDPYGVRPLYFFIYNNTFIYSSELKMVPFDCSVTIHPPGTYTKYKFNHFTNEFTPIYKKSFSSFPPFNTYKKSYTNDIKESLIEAVRIRLTNTEHPIACLLSGGLDSSLITSIVHHLRLEMGITDPIETYSIGLEGAEDLKYASIVAEYLGTKHTNIILTEDDFFNAIPDVIYSIESYDTTTVRASVGNYLVAKYIKEHSKARVIFNGDGSDEVTGGYLYLKNVPSDIEFDKECKRLVRDIHYFDVLRSDRSIASNSLEARTPFLDHLFVNTYFSIPPDVRNPYSKSHERQPEKYLLRKSFEGYLPDSILWRKKEAFSDGVSSLQRSWFTIIQEKIPQIIQEEFKNHKIHHNPPTTPEQYYYRKLFNTYYPYFDTIIPYFWMPKYTNAKDCSARLLE